MSYICIECRQTFATLEEAQRHPYRRLSKDSNVLVPMKRHMVFPQATIAGVGRTGGVQRPEGQ